jgi:hypothetical protein
MGSALSSVVQSNRGMAVAQIREPGVRRRRIEP